ncbi:MAG: S8/S53 family peptidase, partial [Kangiellaceae bacterium]|nr:S8/S53 family peptidase [Kangiellaceae bacterium]
VALKEMSETGMSISMNWLMTSNGISDGFISEESTGETPAEQPEINYTPNPFVWPYINLDSPQDTGVGAAWQLMEFLDARDKGQILVIDAGFIDTGDLPEGTDVSGASWNTANSTNCGGSACPWHGTAVSHVAAATPDNDIGIAGSAGSHARLELLQLNSFSVRGVARLLGIILAAPLNGPPEVINLSGSVEVPPVLNVGVNRLIDPLIGRAHDFGLLIVAAAGNNGTNVDQRAELFGWTLPFERSTIIPCETRSVVCVGGLTYDSIRRHPNSNYGTDAEADSVDIYASYHFWIPKIEGDGTILNTNKLGQGTSYSAPFVSGVIAMMRSANPDLSAEDTVACLLNNAHTHGTTNSSGGNQRRLNAFASVNCAKSRLYSYPLIKILEPASDISVIGQTGINIQAASLGSDGKTLPIQWSSSIDGEFFGQVNNYTLLSIGEHVLTASVTDDDGNNVSETVEVTILNNPPTVEILSPTDGASFGEQQEISLRAHSNDIDSNGRLDDSQISWRVSGQSFTASGHNAQIPIGQLGIGDYTLIATANDGTDSVEQTRSFSIAECIGECPNVQITAPGNIIIDTKTSDDHGFYADVDFSVLATDDEDNNLSSTTIWRSVNSINGAPTTICSPIDIGGVTITCETFTQRLYLGENSADIEYIITASVTDSDGNTAGDTISVTLIFDLD